MQRFISWIIRIALVLGLLAAASFAGAQFKAWQLLGRRSPVRGSEVTFAYRGVQDLRGKPRAWVFDYTQVRLPGVRRVRIVVSITGDVLSATPADLEDRLGAYRRSLEP